MELKIGTLITLEPTFSESMECFKCKVVEQKDNIFYIDYPVSTTTNRTSFLSEGSQFHASFIDEAKIAHAFKTEVLGRVKANVPMIMLSLPTDEKILKIQRREFVRVLTPVDVAVRFNDEYYQFVAEDISAGGSAIILNQKVAFKEDDEIEVTIVLPFSNKEVKYVQTKAQVIRIIERDDCVIAPLSFNDTDEVDRQHLVRFCFDRQLLIRKKETVF
ncbi:flagellar brake domain-containing protein [Viridibacillus sp. YIM B01967]|uniref:Flagellar brake domain-containing protein n=1 Tax=Viridibacillus soli TaxID=2798301 RepID=A0ABS1HCT5_9BACL|nr:flagellar brake domain-containing protein [Viridibacillus soli]MBK3497266.1 flagellar brake domain-containing protein [Viridibacillus soli]